jgi:RNA polymerase sigma factor (sigma-70 family)
MITRHETNVPSSHEYQQKPLHRKWLDYFADLDPEHDGDTFSKVQETELARRIQAGQVALDSESTEDNAEIIAEGEIARKALFEVNIRFALYCARESVGIIHPSSHAKLARLSFKHINGNAAGTYAPLTSMKSPYADLEQREQSALEALWHATAKFHPEMVRSDNTAESSRRNPDTKKRGAAKFCTYAAWHIQSLIQRDAIKEEHHIRLPENVSKRVRATYREMPSGDRMLMPEDIKQFIDRTDYYDFDALAPVDPRDFLHEESDDIARELSDIWADTREVSHVEQEASRLFLEDEIDKILRQLSEREEGVIRMRYGIHPYTRQHTLDEIGDRFGVTRVRIRQIEAKTLEKIRHPSRSEHLRDWVGDVETVAYYTGDSIDARLPQLDYPQPIEQYKSMPSVPTDRAESKEVLTSWQLFKDEKWEDPVRFERDNLLDDESYAKIVSLLTNVSPWHFDMRSYSKYERAYSHSLIQRIENIAGRKRMSPCQLEFLWDSFIQNAYPRLQETLDDNLSGAQVGRFFSRILQINIDNPEMASSTITLTMPEANGRAIHFLASGLGKGSIKIVGDVGSCVAAGNSGVAHVTVVGNAGEQAGANMRGYSELDIIGNTHYHTGNGMRDNASIFISGIAKSVSKDRGYNTQVRQYVSSIRGT